MTSINPLLCEGCGQHASPEHIARRLKRLEWSTRYRPVHIQTLFLGAWSPEEDADFLYSPGDVFQGESATLLEVAGMEPAGKTADALHVEFQRRGYFLAHVLECPLESKNSGGATIGNLLAQRAPAVATRIRRSIKPRRVVLISSALKVLADLWQGGELKCRMLLDEGSPFALDGENCAGIIGRLRKALDEPVPAQDREGQYNLPGEQS